jgi:predicted ABC-type exoprotein transport system permease subunit
MNTIWSFISENKEVFVALGMVIVFVIAFFTSKEDGVEISPDEAKIKAKEMIENRLRNPRAYRKSSLFYNVKGTDIPWS